MPAASSYSESTLKTYMIDVLGGAGSGVAGALGLTTASAGIVAAITAVERILGVDDVADVTDMAKLETISRWLAWSVAADMAATSFDLTSYPGDSLKLSQMFDQINKRLAAALDAALVYEEVQGVSGAGGVAMIADTGGTQLPYGWSWPEF